MLRFLLFFFLFQILTACGSGPVQKSDSAQGIYEYGFALLEDERYEEALIAFADVRNKHPYSRYAVEAKLAVADLHYKRESYVEAQTAYELFKSLHPKHAKSDHVTFRLAMSYFNQLPSSIDRDLSLARKAILYFDETINSYSNSDYTKKALEKKKETRQMLADKELYIARFYLKKENFLSALGRFEGLDKNFPKFHSGEVLYGAAFSAFKIGEVEKGKSYYSKLLSRFPSGSFTSKAKKELKNYVNP